MKKYNDKLAHELEKAAALLKASTRGFIIHIYRGQLLIRIRWQVKNELPSVTTLFVCVAECFTGEQIAKLVLQDMALNGYLERLDPCALPGITTVVTSTDADTTITANANANAEQKGS